MKKDSALENGEFEDIVLESENSENNKDKSSKLL